MSLRFLPKIKISVKYLDDLLLDDIDSFRIYLFNTSVSINCPFGIISDAQGEENTTVIRIIR